MSKVKNKIICVRHLQDQNVLKSYGLNGPLERGQEDKIIASAQNIKNEMKDGGFSRIRILYNDKTIRIEQTAKMLADELGKSVDVSLSIDKRLAIFDQGEVLLPDGYKDGEYFDPLMQAWDVIYDEAYTYRNIDYRFGDGRGFKNYPILAKSFLKSGESIADLLRRRYSLIEDFLNGKLRRQDELLVVCTQSDLPLLLMELQEIAKTDKKVRPEDLPFVCWQIYKEKIQKKYDGDIPMGYTVVFDLSNIVDSGVIDTVVLAKERLEDRASVSPSSIQGKINAIDNDFTEISSEFEKQTGIIIDSKKNIGKDFGFYPISVVIPYYNSRSTILDVLQSIELQNLTKEEMKYVEVVVVNDGWNDDLAKVALPENYSFDLKIVVCAENGGRSAARNIGARNAKHDILMFLDADNLISGECLREHSIRNKFVPDHLYTSLVANLFLKDVPNVLGQYLNNKKPLPIPSKFNEYRTREKIDDNSIGIYEIKNDTVIEILKETDNFRNYGFGRMVAYYDLPSMYATYCVSVTKSMFEKIGGFSEKFKGWGMEDSFFGAEGIVNGAKIIPILSCGSYSINLPSHSGSEKREREEFAKNVRIYKELIRKVY